MKLINTILIVIIVIIVILILLTIYFTKENFTLDNNLSEVEKKIKLLEFSMTSMKDNHNSQVYISNEKKPYKTVYNFY
jgi:cell division protein FtsL